jgi:SNF2 family DNA or RNA helicase
MLDLVGQALKAESIPFERLDGQCTLQQREQAIKAFNGDPDCRVILATMGSAGEGVSFVSGNHVHILEPHWNPMVEAQALNRAHRLGQTRDTTVKRYITRNTVENYVQWIQQDKLRLISRSFDSDSSKTDVNEERWAVSKLFRIGISSILDKARSTA